MLTKQLQWSIEKCITYRKHKQDYQWYPHAISQKVKRLRGAKRRGIKVLIQEPKIFMDELHL